MSSPTGTINESIQSEKKESNAAGVAEEEPLKCNGEQESGPEEETKEDDSMDGLQSKGSYHDMGETLEGTKKEEANDKEEAEAEHSATDDEETKKSETRDIDTSDEEKQSGNGGDETEDMPTGEHVLYPGGGNFNKLRKKQVFLNNLLDSCVDAYIEAPQKRAFVRKEILQKIPGGLYIFSKETGQLYQPEEIEAFDRISQKLRDRKKLRLAALKRDRGEIPPPVRKQKKEKKENSEIGAKAKELRKIAAEERKRKHEAEDEKKNATIAALREEIKKLRWTNNLYNQDAEQLKALIADQTEERQRLQVELAMKKHGKTCGDHPETENDTVAV